MAEKYIMLSLNDDSSKNLSEVLGNVSCKKIINFLAEKNASANEISNHLKAPLNTITYNLEKLVKSGLIEKENHWWSVKGKKIPIYTLSNKQIIISPRKSSFNKLKTIVPLALISGLVAVGINYFSKGNITNYTYDSAIPASASLSQIALKSVEAGNISQVNSIFNSNWIWFLIGCLFSLLLYFIINKILNKR